MLNATVFNAEEWKELSTEKSSMKKHLLPTLSCLTLGVNKTASTTAQTSCYATAYKWDMLVAQMTEPLSSGGLSLSFDTSRSPKAESCNGAIHG